MIKIYNYRDAYVEVFERTVITSKVACRFCQTTFERTTRKCRSDYTPVDKAKFMMQPGTPAMTMITSVGPTGTAYICLNCAKDLVHNLTRELRLKK